MKKNIVWFNLGILLAAATLLSSCGQLTTTTAVAPSSTTSGPTVLTVTSGAKVKTYSMAEIQDDNQQTGYGGEKEQNGTILGPHPYIAILLTDIIYPVGGVANGESVKITAADGSSQTLTYDQIVNGNFNIYNSTGSQITTATKPLICIIFSENGSPLDNSIGPLQLGTLSTMNFITDQSMWLNNVQRIDIIPAQ